MSLYKDALTYYGLSSTNVVLDPKMLLDGLSGGLKGYSGADIGRRPYPEGDIKEILNILKDNPERDKDKKAIMRKTGRESSINSTTGQGLGDTIDNMVYYVDSCAWWLKGWDSSKYIKSRELIYKKFIQDTVGIDNINPRTGLMRTRRRQIPRRIRSK